MPRTVIVVEDNAVLRETLVEHLATIGDLVVVDAVGDAAAAVEAAATHRPDVLVVDHNLPGQTGLDALPALRAAAPDARIVLWTAAPGETFVAGLAHDPGVRLVAKEDGLQALLAAFGDPTLP